MQTLRDEAKEEFGLNGRIRLAWLLHRLIELEATEKEDLIEAWTAGREYGCKHDDPESGEQFYNSNLRSIEPLT